MLYKHLSSHLLFNYKNLRKMTEVLSSHYNNHKNKINSPAIPNEQVQIFVRNNKKKAIKLILNKQILVDELMSVICKKMFLNPTQHLLFLNGQIVNVVEKQAIQLFNGLIFHIVNLNRVHIPYLTIYVKRIEPNSIIHQFRVQSKGKINDFISNKLAQRYQNINDYFLVYTGRQVNTTSTFQQQFVEDGSELLAIHKKQNLKSQHIQNKTESKVRKRLQNKSIKQTTFRRTDSQPVHQDQDDVATGKQKGNKTQENSFKQFSFKKKQVITQQHQNKQEHNNNFKTSQNFQEGNNNLKKTEEGSIIQVRQQDKKQLQFQNTKNGQNLQQQEGANGSSLYETAEFNRIEQSLKNSSGNRNSYDNKILRNNQSIEEQQSIQIQNQRYKYTPFAKNEVQPKNQSNQKEDSQDQETQQIIISNYNALSYNCAPSHKNQSKNDEKSVDTNNMESKIAIHRVQEASNQILTRYGLVPTNKKIDREAKQETSSSSSDVYGVQVLRVMTEMRNSTSSRDQEEKSGDISRSRSRSKDEDSQKIEQKQQEPSIDPYLKLSNNSYGRMSSVLLKTISSRYDDQGISLTNSEVKKQRQNQISCVQSQVLTKVQSSLKYQPKDALGANSGSEIKKYRSNDNELNLKEMDSQNSKKQFPFRNLVKQGSNQILDESICIGKQISPFKNTKQDEPIQINTQQKIDNGSQGSPNSKKQNMVEVKQMIQTVMPAFYHGQNLQGSVSTKSDHKMNFFSEVQINKNLFSPSKESGGGGSDLCIQIIKPPMEQQIMENVAFIQQQNQNNQFLTQPHANNNLNQVLDGFSQTQSAEQVVEEQQNQDNHQSNQERKNDEIKQLQNSSNVQIYVPKSSSSESPYDKLIQLANQQVKLNDSMRIYMYQHKQEAQQENNEGSSNNSNKRYKNINNMSDVSSSYQSQIHSSPSFFAFKPNENVHLPHFNVDLMRQSFTSDPPKEQTDRSQRLSIGSVESQTLYVLNSTQYPPIRHPTTIQEQANQQNNQPSKIDIQTSPQLQQNQQQQKQIQQEQKSLKTSLQQQLQFMKNNENNENIGGSMTLSMKKKNKVAVMQAVGPVSDPQFNACCTDRVMQDNKYEPTYTKQQGKQQQQSKSQQQSISIIHEKEPYSKFPNMQMIDNINQISNLSQTQFSDNSNSNSKHNAQSNINANADHFSHNRSQGDQPVTSQRMNRNGFENGPISGSRARQISQSTNKTKANVNFNVNLNLNDTNTIVNISNSNARSQGHSSSAHSIIGLELAEQTEGDSPTFLPLAQSNICAQNASPIVNKDQAEKNQKLKNIQEGQKLGDQIKECPSIEEQSKQIGKVVQNIDQNILIDETEQIETNQIKIQQNNKKKQQQIELHSDRQRQAHQIQIKKQEQQQYYQYQQHQQQQHKQHEQNQEQQQQENQQKQDQQQEQIVQNDQQQDDTQNKVNTSNDNNHHIIQHYKNNPSTMQQSSTDRRNDNIRNVNINNGMNANQDDSMLLQGSKNSNQIHSQQNLLAQTQAQPNIRHHNNNNNNNNNISNNDGNSVNNSANKFQHNNRISLLNDSNDDDLLQYLNNQQDTPTKTDKDIFKYKQQQWYIQSSHKSKSNSNSQSKINTNLISSLDPSSDHHGMYGDIENVNVSDRKPNRNNMYSSFSFSYEQEPNSFTTIAPGDMIMLTSTMALGLTASHFNNHANYSIIQPVNSSINTKIEQSMCPLSYASLMRTQIFKQFQCLAQQQYVPNYETSKSEHGKGLFSKLDTMISKQSQGVNKNESRLLSNMQNLMQQNYLILSAVDGEVEQVAEDNLTKQAQSNKQQISNQQQDLLND